MDKEGRESMDMERPIQMLPGIGPARAARLKKLGLETADDLLRWFPRQYEDRRTVYPVEGAPVGEKCCVAAVVVAAAIVMWQMKQ